MKTNVNGAEHPRGVNRGASLHKIKTHRRDNIKGTLMDLDMSEVRKESTNARDKVPVDRIIKSGAKVETKPKRHRKHT